MHFIIKRGGCHRHNVLRLGKHHKHATLSPMSTPPLSRRNSDSLVAETTFPHLSHIIDNPVQQQLGPMRDLMREHQVDGDDHISRASSDAVVPQVLVLSTPPAPRACRPCAMPSKSDALIGTAKFAGSLYTTGWAVMFGQSMFHENMHKAVYDALVLNGPHTEVSTELQCLIREHDWTTLFVTWPAKIADIASLRNSFSVDSSSFQPMEFTDLAQSLGIHDLESLNSRGGDGLISLIGPISDMIAVITLSNLAVCLARRDQKALTAGVAIPATVLYALTVVLASGGGGPTQDQPKFIANFAEATGVSEGTMMGWVITATVLLPPLCISTMQLFTRTDVRARITHEDLARRMLQHANAGDATVPAGLDARRYPTHEADAVDVGEVLLTPNGVLTDAGKDYAAIIQHEIITEMGGDPSHHQAADAACALAWIGGAFAWLPRLAGAPNEVGVALMGVHGVASLYQSVKNGIDAARPGPSTAGRVLLGLSSALDLASAGMAGVAGHDLVQNPTTLQEATGWNWWASGSVTLAAAAQVCAAWSAKLRVDAWRHAQAQQPVDVHENESDA